MMMIEIQDIKFHHKHRQEKVLQIEAN